MAQVDHQATISSQLLLKKLTEQSLNYKTGKIIFGQQNAFMEGRGWAMTNDQNWRGVLPLSDVGKVIGKNPGLVGFDFLSIGWWNEKLVHDQMKLIHQKGGVVTLSWHIPNFKIDGTETDAWDISTPTVKFILENAKYKMIYLKKLDRLVEFLHKVSAVPILFRPFHEHNESWFWWGENFCTPEEYKRIWNLTADYLQSKGVHNLLYVYSPNHVLSDYLERYPGNDRVDVMGVDFYFLSKDENNGQIEQLNYKKQVYSLIQIATRNHKIPAITEVGSEGIILNQFWTDYFSWPLEKEGLDQIAKLYELPIPKMKVAYAMVWRNDSLNPVHFYAPYPGHALNDNFKLMILKDKFKFLEDK
jgi:mannan endo-1,4-beta-mannosidase